jgi:hypothetical protein
MTATSSDWGYFVSEIVMSGQLKVLTSSATEDAGVSAGEICLELSTELYGVGAFDEADEIILWSQWF